MKSFTNFLNDESGVTAIEYALIASVMALCLVAALPFLSKAISDKFKTIGDHIASGT